MKRPFLPAVAAIALGYCVLALALALVDPLGLYPWGVSPRLKPNNDYSMESTPFLVDAVAKDPTVDTLLLGGSTGHFYTAEMMEATLPRTLRAFNLSYGGPSALDRGAVASQILRYSRARRFILEVDWSYTTPTRDQRTWASFPIYLYDGKWWNDIRDINWQTIKLSLAVLAGRPLWIEAWGKGRDQQAYQKRYDMMHSETTLTEYAAIVARHRDGIDAPSHLTCDAMDAIGGQLIPFVRELSRRGAQVDLVFPPYSWMIYYRAAEPGDPLNRPTLLSDVLMMRKCVVAAAGAVPGVEIFAFDDVPSIAGDFRNYFDAGHLYSPESNRYILQAMAKGEHRLTLQNVEEKNSEMRSNVTHFQLTGGLIGSTPQ